MKKIFYYLGVLSATLLYLSASTTSNGFSGGDCVTRTSNICTKPSGVTIEDSTWSAGNGHELETE